jgi:hypothetical protein
MFYHKFLNILFRSDRTLLCYELQIRSMALGLDNRDCLKKMMNHHRGFMSGLYGKLLVGGM